jgi:hypothetical protein
MILTHEQTREQNSPAETCKIIAVLGWMDDLAEI